MTRGDEQSGDPPPSAGAGDRQHASLAFIITHVIATGAEPRYEEWLADILGAVSSFPGYLGRDIFRPAHGATNYTTLVRFDTQEHLDAWAASEIRRSYIARVLDLLEHGDRYEVRTGIDFWFTPEGVRPPKPWKQFLLTLSAVYPLTQLLPALLRPLFRLNPVLAHPRISGFILAATLTALLTFVIMPRYTRFVRPWLYRDTA